MRDEKDKLIKKNTKTLEWRNLNYTIKNKKTKREILVDISGKIESGKILGILGPSGGGKSTFLDVLSQRRKKKNQTGEIYFDGEKIEEIKYISSYVMQDEVLFENFSVYQNIFYSAELNLNEDNIKNKKKSVKKRTNEVISDFGLQKVKNQKIGSLFTRGLSGGEKRKTYIATQMVYYKSIVFMDEPTTGLDSHSSLNIIKIFKEIAMRNNLIIIMTLHQPSSLILGLLDKLFFISKGKTIFFGDTDKCVKYFDSIQLSIPHHINPSEFILNIINNDFFKDKLKGDQKIDLLNKVWNQYGQQILNDQEVYIDFEIIKEIKMIDDKFVQAFYSIDELDKEKNTVYKSKIKDSKFITSFSSMSQSLQNFEKDQNVLITKSDSLKILQHNLKKKKYISEIIFGSSLYSYKKMFFRKICEFVELLDAIFNI